MSWREQFYNSVRKKALEDSLRTKEAINDLVYSEFTNFMEPIQDLAEISMDGETHKYRVYDKILKVEYKEEKVYFSQISLTLNGNEGAKETSIAEFFHNGVMFLKKDERYGQNGDYISKDTIDSIFKEAFNLGSALRIRD
ncbi:hypothetical protein [Brevibacillus centrosporus]|uniref:hypothetical protein n=1 Tax=Brevibacillus centrosporus TaxID=54910 RepID=UPI00398827CD